MFVSMSCGGRIRTCVCPDHESGERPDCSTPQGCWWVRHLGHHRNMELLYEFLSSPRGRTHDCRVSRRRQEEKPSPLTLTATPTNPRSNLRGLHSAQR